MIVERVNAAAPIPPKKEKEIQAPERKEEAERMLQLS